MHFRFVRTSKQKKENVYSDWRNGEILALKSKERLSSVIGGNAVKAKQIIMIAALALMPLIAGCSNGGADASYRNTSSEYSTESSAEPFDTKNSYSDTNDPKLQYLGSQDLTKSPAYELYMKNYAQNADGNVIEWERVSPGFLAERLSERISSDLSPDLCDKIDNSLPYLSKKNLFEDLTEYIDITAPQWESYAEYISVSGGGKGRYFYPTTITASPNVLLYSKSKVSRYGITDPLTLWHNKDWTFGTIEQAFGGYHVISGSALAENFLASSGTSLFTIERNGKVSSNLHTENFAKSAAFVAANCTQIGGNSYHFTDGIGAIQSGECLFLSITQSELERVRRDYPDSDFEIVPFPRSDSADKHYYYATTEGYLVPKRAKNIKAAASFINFSRIAAQTYETSPGSTDLSDADIQTLSEIRSADFSQLVFDTNHCLDSDANSSVGSIFTLIYTYGDDRQLMEEFIKKLEVPVVKSISEINQSTE